MATRDNPDDALLRQAGAVAGAAWAEADALATGPEADWRPYRWLLLPSLGQVFPNACLGVPCRCGGPVQVDFAREFAGCPACGRVYRVRAVLAVDALAEYRDDLVTGADGDEGDDGEGW